MPISSKKGIEEYYKQQKIAKKYIKERFSTPLGKFHHYHQINLVNKFVKGKKILDLACGPGRLSKDIHGFEEAFAADSSEEMLEIAKIRLLGWKIKKQDAFNLTLKDKFDLVYSFRLIRHFKEKERKQVYKQIKKILKPNGILIFDAVNYNKSHKVRKRKGLKHYPIYDKLYRKKELIRELQKNGFKDIKLYPCINHLYTITLISKITAKLKLNSLGYKLIRSIEKNKTNTPLEWIIVCRN